MKKCIFFTCLFLVNSLLIAQNKSNFIAINPSKISKVNGLMLTFWDNDQKKLPTINGIEINMNPMVFLAPMVFAHGLFDSGVKKPYNEKIDTIDFSINKKINGVHIGLASFVPTNVNGIAFNVLGINMSKINGVLISPLLNRNYDVKGLTIGVIGNHDVKCNGVQIGLFNSCTELYGLQIGLFNKNQKRKMPFINWNFKKKSKK